MERHVFRDGCAPGDFKTQQLLADLCCMVARLSGLKDAKAKDFAPWLFTESDGKEKKKRSVARNKSIALSLARRE